MLPLIFKILVRKKFCSVWDEIKTKRLKKSWSLTSTIRFSLFYTGGNSGVTWFLTCFTCFDTPHVFPVIPRLTQNFFNNRVSFKFYNYWLLEPAVMSKIFCSHIYFLSFPEEIRLKYTVNICSHIVIYDMLCYVYGKFDLS